MLSYLNDVLVYFVNIFFPFNVYDDFYLTNPCHVLTYVSIEITERILQLGVSDLEEECFKRLHASSEIRPSIIQINLSSCCVVPPGLQAFCKDNDVQLLTHSDPQGDRNIF